MIGPKQSLRSCAVLSLAAILVASLFHLRVAAQPTFPRPDKLTIGNLPIIVHAQGFGAHEKGWLDELGVKQLEFQRFTSGTPFLQAIAAGQVDIGYIGIGPLFIAARRGLPVKAVAATSKDTMVLVATDEFARIYATQKSPKPSLDAFGKQAGRRLRIGSVPKGTTPDVFLRMWLVGAGVDPERDVEILPMGADQLVAAMVAGQVDAVVNAEPQVTLIRRADPKFKVLLYGRDVVAGLPGGVVMVQQRLIDRYPAMIEKLVEIHLRANKLLNSDREFFARAATRFFGEQVLPLDVAREAVRSPATHMVTDLRPLLPALAVYDTSWRCTQTWTNFSPMSFGSSVG